MVELQIVVLAVAGSSPVGHPIFSPRLGPLLLLLHLNLLRRAAVECKCKFRSRSKKSPAIAPRPGLRHTPRPMPAIETHGLTKVYRTYKKAPGLWGAIKGLGHREYEDVRAADGVTFSIEEGEFVGFLGPNGAGKTTVLKMLSGLLNPTSGTAKRARLHAVGAQG